MILFSKLLISYPRYLESTFGTSRGVVALYYLGLLDKLGPSKMKTTAKTLFSADTIYGLEGWGFNGGGVVTANLGFGANLSGEINVAMDNPKFWKANSSDVGLWVVWDFLYKWALGV